MKKMPDARKTSHGKGLGKLMAVLPKAMCRLSAILFRIVMLFFTEGERHILKIHREAQKTPIAKAILGKKQSDVTVSDFKLCYRNTVTKAAL